MTIGQLENKLEDFTILEFKVSFESLSGPFYQHDLT